MFKKFFQNIRYLLLLILLFFVLIISINNYVINLGEQKIVDLDKLEKHKVGLVFGASVLNNSIPSDILKDRLDIAIKAYNKGKIENIIVSGDNRELNYNEPQAMYNYLIKSGVKKEDIYKDYAGFDTYDSLYRAKHIFGVSKLVLFTQEYHLIRALYISNKLGINSVGVSTDLNYYYGIYYFRFRELASRTKAFIEVEILKSSSRYLGEKIEIN